MNGNLTVKSLAELETTHRRQAVGIFVDSYYQKLSFLSTETEKLIDVLEHSFVPEQYYAGLMDETVVGIIACSTGTSRSHRFDRKQFVKYLGLLRGLLGYRRLWETLQKPLDLASHQCYIESVATDTAFRGKGIATMIQEYLLRELPYKEYLLEVEQSNKAAVKLYQRLGFTVIPKEMQPAAWNAQRKTQMILMRKCIDTQ